MQKNTYGRGAKVHGTRGRYSSGCRCEPCKEADNSYTRKYRDKARARRDSVKNVPCMDCGIKYPPYVMQFDHVRGQKLFNIGLRIDANEVTWTTEIAKCDIVCANCHAERTHQRLFTP